MASLILIPFSFCKKSSMAVVEFLFGTKMNKFNVYGNTEVPAMENGILTIVTSLYVPEIYFK